MDKMNVWEGVLMGIIQGVTEFLPVSSSGHLVLFGGGKMTLFTEVLLHAATLVAVVVVFWKEVWALIASLRHVPRGNWQDPNLKLLLLILLASVPAALLGILLHDFMEKIGGHPARIAIVSSALLVTGLILLSTWWLRRRAEGTKPVPGWLDGFLIGIAQAAAILPGLSRSGLTISAGLWRGLTREQAGVFAFLLSLPAIGGATLLEMIKLFRSGGGQFQASYHVAGFLAALVTGYLALRFLLRLVKQGRLHYFAWYCFALAAAGFLFIK